MTENTPRRRRGNPSALEQLTARLEASRASDREAREKWVEEYVEGPDEHGREPSSADKLQQRLDAGTARSRARVKRAQAIGRRMNGTDTR